MPVALGDACGIFPAKVTLAKAWIPKVNHKEALEMATVGFFASQILFLTPNQQCKWTEGAKAD